MLNRRWTQFFWASVLAVFSLGLAGCAGTSVVSDENLAKAPYKLSEVTVVWVDKEKLPYRVTKGCRGCEPKIEDSDKRLAFHVVRKMLIAFRQSAPAQIVAKLDRMGVEHGGRNTLELTPVEGSAVIGGGRSLTIRAAIIDAKIDKEVWSIAIRANGPNTDSDEVFVSNFVERLVAELSKVGWLDAK